MAIIKIPDGKGGWIKFPTIKGDKGLTGDQGVKGDIGAKGVVIQKTEPEENDVIWVNPEGDYPAIEVLSEEDIINIINTHVPKFDTTSVKSKLYDNDKITVWDNLTQSFMLVTKDVMLKALGIESLVSKDAMISLIEQIMEEAEFRRLS